MAKKKVREYDLVRKKALIEKNSTEFSINEQCNIIGLNKGSLYYKKTEYSDDDIKILHRMDEIFTECPFYGYRKIYNQLKNEGLLIGRDRVLKYMNILGLETFYPKKKKGLSEPDKENKIYPYLLTGIEIKRPNQVWSIDITYIRMVKGFLYLVAIIDWYSKYLLSYKLSNSLEIYFCLEVLKDALNRYKNPEIINSDQGSQFTSRQFTNIIRGQNIKISMDSKGRALDNIAIERFFRTLKYENIYITEYRDVKELKEGLKKYIEFYNCKRLHQALKYKTPTEIYEYKDCKR